MQPATAAHGQPRRLLRRIREGGETDDGSPAPDSEPTAHSYRSGELLTYYWDWEILYFLEEIFDCTSSGVPHRHAVNRIVARQWTI